MFEPPTVDQVVEVAASLGIHIGGPEAAAYQGEVSRELRILYDLLQSRIAEDRPPIRYPERAFGHRPTADSDPYRAWLWHCRFGGRDEGVLARRRVSFKDHISVAGIPQSFTSTLLDGFVPDIDATIVTRTLDAGGEIIGKNMMSGFMGDFGTPINPHDIRYSAGGSSSGSAVALAAGDVDVSFGGDQGGSIRIPSAYCGIVGLKPTFGLVSHFGVSFGADESVDHVGPMARRVEDVAAALEAVAGYDSYDPRQTRAVPERFDARSRLDAGVARLRIGVLEEGFDEPVDAEVRDRTLAAVDVLAAAGASVRSVSVPEHRAIVDVYAALAIEGAKAVTDTGLYGSWHKTYYPIPSITAVDKAWRDHADLFPAVTKINHLVAAFSRRYYHGAVYAKAQNMRPTFVRAYDRALADVDVLVMPTVREIAPPVKATATDPVATIEDEIRRRNWMFLPHTYNTKPMNYTGHPALAVPCGRVRGLPVSIQLVGRFFEDALLLQVAFAYQESVDWEAFTRAPIG